MQGKRLIFRADGDSNIGLGHLYRLFSLVEMLKANFDFVFVTNTSSVCSVIPSEYTVKLIPENISFLEEPKWLSEHFQPTDHLIISDGYHFTSIYQQHLKTLGFKTVYIDDLAQEHQYADIVINHSPSLLPSAYQKEDYTKLALGTNYALLRPAFLEHSKSKRKIAQIQDVFLCFGGADPSNFTGKLIQVLSSFSTVERIHVLKGAANKHEFSSKRKNQIVHVYQNLNENEISELMSTCHLAIVPSSTILYELCSVNIPIISGYFVDNQINIYKGFLENSAIFGIKDFRNYNVEDLTLKVKPVLESGFKFYSEMMDNQARMFDTKVSQRITELINSLC